MRTFIKDWEALAAIPNESKTHTLEVDLDSGNGWLIAKNEKRYTKKLSYMRQVPYLDVYLSTHTFYGGENERMSKVLRACGFDVELNNWDK